MEQSDRARDWATGLLLAVLAGYLAHIALFWTQINDDAFITFRYSRFLAEGRGPYFNVGEHVEGYTNFLLMLLMAAVIRLAGPDEVLFAAKLVGVGGGGVAICAAVGLARRWLERVDGVAAAAAPLACLAGAIVAVNSGFALNSTTGLETTLFSGLILLGLYLDQLARDRERWRGCGVALALAALTRPEGAAVFAAMFVGRLVIGEWRTRGGRVRLLLDGGLVAATVAAHLGLRMVWYDGELVPNTYFAKAGGLYGVTAADYLRRFAWHHAAGAIAGLGLFVFVARQSAAWRAALPALAVALYAALIIFKTGADWMPGFRLLVPFVPVYAALATLGLAALSDRLFAAAAPPRRVAAAASAGVALLAALLVWEAPVRREYYVHSSVRNQGYLAGHRLLAEWLLQNGAPGQTVALMDIGLIGYTCIDMSVLDITGLTDRTIARSPGGFLDKRFDPNYVLDRRPEFVVLVLRDNPTAPGAEGLNLWTGIEASLFTHPGFARAYLRPRPGTTTAGELERLAATVGAAAVFEHLHPAGERYLLTVFRRGE